MAEVPRFANDALARKGVAASWRASGIAGRRAEAWSVTIPGESAVEIRELLRATKPVGWWPLILGSDEDEARLVEAHAYAENATIAAIVESAAALDPIWILGRRREEINESFEGDEPDYIGTWPDHPIPSSELSLPVDILSRKYRPTVVAIVAVERQEHVPAALAWGGWNDCPTPEEHVAVLSRWIGAFDAQIVGTSGDVIEMNVGRPPKTREAAMALADEQLAYCSDIVLQGTETVSALASTLLDGTTWFFWWD